MTTTKELNLGIEAWIAGFITVALLLAATLIPQKPATEPSFEHPSHQLRAQLDLPNMPGRGNRIGG